LVYVVDFVQLVAGPEGRSVFLDPFGDGREDGFALRLAGFVIKERPLGVEPDVFDLVATFQFGHPFLDGGFVLHDDLQLVSLDQVFVKRKGIPLGGDGNPVKVAANGKGSAGLKVYGEGTNTECVSEFVEIVNGGFATSEDDDLATGSEGGLCEGFGFSLLKLFGKVIGMPSAGGVAPRAFHGAAL
jgi:hypothetical protein